MTIRVGSYFGFGDSGEDRDPLVFTPDGRQSTHFNVTVTNTGDRVLPFQVELSLPEVDWTPHTKWYRVEPHIISQRVGGQITNFRVELLEMPLSLYGKLTMLLVKVTSPELNDLIYSEELKLKVGDRPDSNQVNGRIHLKPFRGELTFIPDHDTNPDSELDIVVTNDSDRFTSFKLELLPFDTDIQSDTKWYTVEPQVSTKKPPGESTNFHLKIIREPIPIYDSSLNLALKIFSIEDENLSIEKPLKLTIKSPAKPLKLSLPADSLKVLPGNTIDIPVLIYSLSSKRSQITLTLADQPLSSSSDQWRSQSTLADLSDASTEENEPQFLVPLSWLQPISQQTITLNAGSSQQVIFQCCPPAESKTLRKIYTFVIEARSNTSHYVARVEGKLEVLPWGYITMDCTNPQITIPSRNSDLDAYEIWFKNESNTDQIVCLQPLNHESCDRIKLAIAEAPHQPLRADCHDAIEVEVQDAETAENNRIILKPDLSEKVTLKPIVRRNLLGWKRRRFLVFTPILQSQNLDISNPLPDQLVDLKPDRQLLELVIYPLIPPLLQLGGAILLVLLLWLAWFLNPKSYHTGTVNSVRLIGNGGTVVSGSSDRTLRRWQVNRNPWMPDVRRLNYEGIVTDEVGRSVRVIRQIPEHDQQIAVGLENGEIQLWDVSLGEQLRRLTLQGNDRVFDLDFTRNSRYLLSGHGSGIARIWDLNSPDDTPPIAQAYPKFAISAVAIQEQPQETPANSSSLAVIAGQYNRLVLWDWQQRQLYQVAYPPPAAEFTSVSGQHDYINSVNISDDQQWLVTADSQGYITLWDMQQLRQCVQSSQQPGSASAAATDGVGNAIASVTCDNSVLGWWREESNPQPIRSVALSQRGCHLASVGDDGRVLWWTLHSDAFSGQRLKKPTLVAQFSDTQLNSVDITATRDHVLIASDASQNRVWLFQRKRTNSYADCQ